MGGRKPLRHGAPRLLGRHDGRQGRAYSVAYADLVAALGPFPTRLLRFEAGRVALARVNLEEASGALAALRHARATGRGRRPSTRDLERAQRRQALQDQSYSQALGALRELLAATRRPASVADLVRAGRPA
jgi:hypothetical protein